MSFGLLLRVLWKGAKRVQGVRFRSSEPGFMFWSFGVLEFWSFGVEV